MNDKTKAYIGLCRRAGKLTEGVQAGFLLHKRVYLLVADSGAGSNSRDRIEDLKKKFRCPLIYVSGLGEMLNRPICRLVLVRDKNFADAILQAETDADIKC